MTKSLTLQQIKVLNQAVIILHESGHVTQALELVKLTSDELDALIVERGLS